MLSTSLELILNRFTSSRVKINGLRPPLTTLSLLKSLYEANTRSQEYISTADYRILSQVKIATCLLLCISLRSCQGARRSRYAVGQPLTALQLQHSPCKGAVKDCFPLPHGECLRSSNGVWGQVPSGVLGQRPKVLASQTDKNHGGKYPRTPHRYRVNLEVNLIFVRFYKGFSDFVCIEV